MIGGVEDGGRFGDFFLPGREVVLRIVPVGVVEDEVLVELGAEAVLRVGDPGGAPLRGGDDPRVPTAAVVLAAVVEPVVDRLAVRGRSAVDGVDGRKLLRGDAVVGRPVARAARQVRRLEAAPARIVEHAVLDPVVRVARGKDARPEQLERGRREDRRVEIAVGIDRLLVLHEAGGDARPVVGGRSGDDAVEVLRIALRFHHRLPPAPRAADEVGVIGGLLVVVRDDRLRRLGGQVDGAMTEVLLPLGVVERPAGLDTVPGVPGVGPDRRVAALQGAAAMRVQRARLVLHGSDEAAAAAHQEAAVPVVGQQELEVDLRLDGPGHLAVRRQLGLARHTLGRADPQIDQRQRGEICAGVRLLGGGGGARRSQRQTGGNGNIHELAVDAGHRWLSLCLQDPPNPISVPPLSQGAPRPRLHARI